MFENKALSMHKDTQLATTQSPDPAQYGGAVNIPPFRASTILFKTLAEFEAAERGEAERPTYGRYGTPSTVALEAAIAEMEGADHTIIYASGQAAIVASLLAFVKAGDHVLIPDSVYGTTRRFCEFELKRLGVEVVYYDPRIGGAIAELMKDNTRLVYCESPGSLTFEMQDIPAIAAAAHARGALVVADNTWATPLYFQPLAHGVDISMQSVTKYISGHSDLVMGALSCKAQHYKRLLAASRNLGAAVSGDNCYLAMRGLRTLAVRLQQHQSSALQVAQWLQTRSEVERVIYPALPGDTGHALWKRDMAGATGLFSVLLKPCSHAALEAMIDGLELFHMGYSWGGFESLLIPFSLATRTATAWEHKGANLRLHIGLEHPQDLISDLHAGFARMKAHA